MSSRGTEPATTRFRTVFAGGISKCAVLFLKTAVKELNSGTIVKPYKVNISRFGDYTGAY